MANQASRAGKDVTAMLRKVPPAIQDSQESLVRRASPDRRGCRAWASEGLTASPGCPETLELTVSQESQEIKAHLVTQVSASRSMNNR